MSAFSSFCVPEVEGYGPLRGNQESLSNLPVLEQVGGISLSAVGSSEFATSTSSEPACLQHLVRDGLSSTDVCCIDADSTLTLVDLKELKCTYTVAGAHEAPVTSCSFLHCTPHVLVTSSQDGAVKLWDMRSPPSNKGTNRTSAAAATVQIAARGSREADLWALAVRGDDLVFAASLKNAVKGYDIRAVCSGTDSQTESLDNDKKPRRKKGERRLLWNFQVHGDSVTAIQFHPLYPHLLVSGGEDYLVCIVDTRTISNSNGIEAAPIACFSQERPVKGFSLVGPGRSCICIRSAMEDVGLWQVDGLERFSVSPSSEQEVSVHRRAEWLSVRNHVAIREELSCGYVVDTFYDELVGRLFILAGSVSGRLLLLHANLDGVAPAAVFSQQQTSSSMASQGNHIGFKEATHRPGGHTGVVRGAVNVPGSMGDGLGRLVTCGEDGRVCVWRQSSRATRRLVDSGERSALNDRNRHPAATRPY